MVAIVLSSIARPHKENGSVGRQEASDGSRVLTRPFVSSFLFHDTFHCLRFSTRILSWRLRWALAKPLLDMSDGQ